MLSLRPLAFAMMIVALGACTRSPQPQDQPAPAPRAIDPLPLHEYQEEEEDATPVTYVRGICDGEIPSDWQVRPEGDQRKWNRAFDDPAELTAEKFYERLVSSPVFRPAVHSMADADTYLGITDDPGAEDANRNEVDILVMSRAEMEKLLPMIVLPPEEYSWGAITVDGVQAQVLRNVMADGKFFGIEIVFLTADATQGMNGLIIVNRSNDHPHPSNRRFRSGFAHFLETLDLASCPEEWKGN